jgi:hypothetical protein
MLQPGPTHPKVSTALVLGAFSLGCAGFFTGIPGIFAGLAAKREIARSRGQWSGEGQAIAAIMMSFIGTIASIAFCVMVAGSALTARLTASAPSFIAPKFVTLGQVQIVELPKRRGALAQALQQVVAQAGARSVIVQTRFRRCGACDEFQSAMGDSTMQAALAGTVLVRVDVATFRDELAHMKIVTDSAPWFYKIDSTLHPVDGISAGEWDENIPANMAPVLASFVRGTLAIRRAK